MNPLALALCGGVALAASVPVREVSVALERTGNHSERGQISVLNLLEGIAEHAESPVRLREPRLKHRILFIDPGRPSYSSS